ncbi:restriction endonuclease subunit S [Escherichia coli]|uniref:restriction endonuclease subunit S n=1 Tax=Escherichia TaxID=561 RepID=UPI000CF7A577|nr:restriction endonuclease subunit S [Escherichia sp. MOD1-EC5189]EIY7828601.1 restriction endonuclease subunit S [Escherichia coli]
MSAGKLPEGWVDTQLGNVVDYGKTSKKVLSEVNDDTWILELEDIEKASSKLLNKVTASERPFKSTKNSFRKGDILYGKLRPYLNKIIIANDDGVCTTEIIPINAEPICFNKYLFYWLKSSTFLSYVNDVSYGVNMPRLGTTDGLKAPLRLAPLAEQKIIAEKLDTLLAQVDSTKARLEQIPQILKRFRQAVLAAAMRGELSETWRTHNSFNISLHKYYELTKGKKLKAKNIAEPCEENTWLRCNIGHIFNVKSGDGLTAKEMNSSGDIPVYGGNGITGYHDKYNTEESTIVIGRVGYYCGSVHLTPEKSWITDNALLVDFNRDLITEKFAYWLLKATNLRVDTSSSAQPVISGAKIYSIEIVVPPVEEQHEIVRRVEQLFAYADTIEKQVNNALARVNNLTQSILAKAFRGELTAQWRAENPDSISGENSAAALLEKIKAERAASGGKKASRKKS